MTQPELIELAASIADYCVTNEYPFSYTTELDENGDDGTQRSAKKHST